MYKAGDVRVENVPDPVLREPTDAIVRVTSACICGSDLWPYQSMPANEQGRRMGHEFIGIVEEVGSEVSGFAPATWSSRRSCGRTTPATSARPGCRSPAVTAAAGANPAWTRARARPCGCRWPRARWSSSPSRRTRR